MLGVDIARNFIIVPLEASFMKGGLLLPGPLTLSSLRLFALGDCCSIRSIPPLPPLAASASPALSTSSSSTLSMCSTNLKADFEPSKQYRLRNEHVEAHHYRR